MKKLGFKLATICLVGFLFSSQLFAHHILGRPSYGLTEESNTPPSVQQEVQVRDYITNIMVYPAFPKPGQTGRINFYASNSESGKSFSGDVTFTLIRTSWWASKAKKLGEQFDENYVFQQHFEVPEEGDYILKTEFKDKGEVYTAEFPIQIGTSAVFGPVGYAVGFAVLLLIISSVVKRNQLQRVRTRRHRNEPRTDVS